MTQLPESDVKELDQLEREAEQAEAKARALQGAIVEGDPKASVAELVDVEADVAKRRGLIEATRNLFRQRAENKAEEARLARIAEYGQLIQERFGAHEGDLIEAFDASVAALAVLAERVQEHNTGFREIYHQLVQLGELPADVGIELNGATPGRPEVRLPGIATIELINAAVLMDEAGSRAFKAAGNHGRVLDPTGMDVPRCGDVHTTTEAEINAYGPEYGTRYPGSSQRYAGPSDRLRRLFQAVAERDGS